MDFHARWLKRRGLAQSVPNFGGFVDTAPHFGGEISPPTLQPQFLGREYAFSSQTSKILKVSYYRNYRIDFNKILHRDRDRQVVIAGGRNARRD